MDKRTQRLGVYMPILFLAILTAVTLRTVACLTDLQLDTGFFENKTVINIASYLTLGFAVLLLSYIFFAKKDEKLIPSFSSPATYIPTALVSVATVFFALDIIGSARGSLKAFGIILGILGFAAVFHFILNAFITSDGSSARAALGLAAVVFIAFFAAYLYFDTTMPLNAPNKIIDQMAHLFAALFLLYETRISLGRAKWNLYIAFGLIASLMTAYSAIPSLIMYFVRGTVISASIYESAFLLTLFVFITARLIVAAYLPKDETCPFICKLKSFSEKRTNEIKEKEEAERLTYLEIMKRFSEVDAEEDDSFTEDEGLDESKPDEGDASIS